MEEVATAHWNEIAPPEHREAYAWLVTRHEIDYRGNIREGEQCEATTEIGKAPSGARFERRTTCRDLEGKLLVGAVTIWAMIDRATGRLMRVPRDVAAQYLADEKKAAFFRRPSLRRGMKALRRSLRVRLRPACLAS